MVSLLIVVFGISALMKLPIREYPDIDPPQVSVEVTYEGAAPEVLDTQIIQVVEGAIAGVEGVGVQQIDWSEEPVELAGGGGGSSSGRSSLECWLLRTSAGAGELATDPAVPKVRTWFFARWSHLVGTGYFLGVLLGMAALVVFTDIVFGGSGTDTLDIDYTGVDSLSDFTITYDSTNGYIVLTDANGGVIKFKNIENLTVGDYAYTRYQDRDDEYGDAYWNATEATLYLWDGNGRNNLSSVLDPDDREALPGLTKTMNVTVHGSDAGDYFNLNIDRVNDYTGNWTLNMGAGNDTFGAAALKNGDSVDMGAGDDEVALIINSSTPTVANLSLAKLDGGAGTDTLSFLNFTNTAEISLTTGGATNFENILGSGGAETIKGDNGDNILTGAGGADILYGYAGNDVLAGSNRGMPTLAQVAEWDSGDSWDSSNNAGNNTLYGGAGNDKLFGGYFDDTLDGGTGTDTLNGGNGTDTFIIRSGDGSTTLANANVITDFTNGTDVIAMDSITFDDLTIAQGTGDYASHTLVSVTATGEYLLIIQNITNSFATRGYATIAPAFFDRIETGIELDYSAESIEKGKELKSKVSWDDTITDIRASANFIRDFSSNGFKSALLSKTPEFAASSIISLFTFIKNKTLFLGFKS